MRGNPIGKQFSQGRSSPITLHIVSRQSPARSSSTSAMASSWTCITISKSFIMLSLYIASARRSREIAWTMFSTSLPRKSLPQSILLTGPCRHRQCQSARTCWVSPGDFCSIIFSQLGELLSNWSRHVQRRGNLPFSLSGLDALNGLFVHLSPKLNDLGLARRQRATMEYISFWTASSLCPSSPLR